MKITPDTRTCQHCKKKFIPDCRNRYHQRFCAKSACRRASKRHSQEKWLAKNPGFFSGADNVLRVQIWRQEHGRGRGRRIFKMVLELLIFRRKGRSESVKIVKRDGNGHVLQDVCELKNSIKTRVILRLVSALQDFIAELGAKTYSPAKKGGKAVWKGKRECRRVKRGRRVCLKRSRSSTTRRWKTRRRR